MVLNDNGIGDASRFFKEQERVSGVVKYVDEHRCIEACVGMRDDTPVKRFYRNSGVGTDEDIDALDGDVRTCLLNEVVKIPPQPTPAT